MFRYISRLLSFVLILVVFGCQAVPPGDSLEKLRSLPRMESLMPYRQMLDISFPVANNEHRGYAVISYAVLGDPTKPVLIFVPGYPGGMGTASGLFFGANSDGVGGLINDFRVIIVELPGQGMTQIVDQVGAVEDFENLVYFLDKFIFAISKRELHGRKFHLVGHSYGAEVCWRYAARNPEAISSLTLIDASGFRREKSEIAASEKHSLELLSRAAVQLNSESGRKELAGAAKRKEADADIRQGFVNHELLQRLKIDDEYWCYASTRGNLIWTMQLTHQDIKRRDEAFTRTSLSILNDRKRAQFRTLLIWGDKDPWYTVKSQGSRFLECIDRSILIVLKDCGHCPHEEFPGRVASTIRKFAGVPNITLPVEYFVDIKLGRGIEVPPQK